MPLSIQSLPGWEYRLLGEKFIFWKLIEVLLEILEVSKIIFLWSMFIVSAITNIFFSLIVIIIAIVELFFIWIGILHIVGIFLMGILNIVYACMRLYVLRVQQWLIENSQVTYYNCENAEPEQLVQEAETIL